MRTHTNDYKNGLKGIRETLTVLTKVADSQEIEEINLKSLKSILNADLLKSVMKELDIESKIDIPLNTELNLQLGVKVRNDEVEDERDNYDFINYGNYIVYESNYQVDSKIYKIICYDKMLYSMVDYETPKEYVLTLDEEFIDGKPYYELVDDEYVEYTGPTTGNPSQLGLYEYVFITFPITIKNYINKIATHLGLEFANINDEFANYNKEIPNELYLSTGGSSLGYTFRDVLDELSQATASNICINENNQLEVRYVTDTEDTIDENYLKAINVEFGEKYGPVNSIVLSRSAESDNVYLSDDESIAENGLCEIKISDNQIMNFNDRADYLPDMLEKLDGLEYYLNDFSSTGITYLDVCDMYNISIGNDTYNCLMLNDKTNITSGLSEDIYTDMPPESITDYKKADKTDRKINQAYIIVDKQNQQIEALTSATEELSDREDTHYQDLLSEFGNYATLESVENVTNQVTQLQTDTYTKTQVQQIVDGTGVDGVTVSAVISTEAQFDKDGMHYSKTNAPTSSTIDYKGLQVDKTEDNSELLFAGYDEEFASLTYGTSIVRTGNLTVNTYLQCADGKGRIEKYTDSDNNVGVGFFLT